MKLNNRSIVVTGGAGFIGSHLVDALIKHEPEKLTVIDNFFIGSMDNLSEAKKKYKSLEIIKQDLTDFESVEMTFKKNSIDAVFNLAVVPLPVSLVKPEWTYEQNVKMTLNLCKLMRKGHFKTLIQCSSSEVYGSAVHIPMNEEHPQRPMTPYAASKVATDFIAVSYYETFGMEVTLPRPFNTYGPRQNFKGHSAVVPLTIKRILENKVPVIYGDGSQTRDFIYVEDAAKGILDTYLSSKTRGKVVNIASGEEVSINELVKLIMRHMNCRLKIDYEKPRPGDVKRHKADISLAKKLINFKPSTDIKTGMKKTIDYFQKKIR